MNILTYPLGYLQLKDEDGNKLYRRNGVAIVILTMLISVPFIISDANFFGDKGFLDRIGSFSGVLTGFYIAALVGVASFSSTIGGLDDEITIGPITRVDLDGETENMTRRQYVCALFGYLSFTSLIISIGSILLIVIGGTKLDITHLLSDLPRLGAFLNSLSTWIRDVIILLSSLVVAHLVVTTCHGLYYMIDRLYHKDAEILEKSPTEPPRH